MPKKKKAEEVVIEPKVLDSSLEDIVADRFSRYSKYIIQERALPDARDGLKPVQRRILWAMYEDGNTSDRPYRKSAKTVGNVIGNYHPHGDSSVYDAIVRLSQDWKATLPLIDMQGNNGSIDDDPAAAMRYTEARLSPIADYLMEDIDKDTVEWAPNFSDEKMEPTVLPARYPNLLINGVTGIAAGYATNIPPHNFNEVIDGVIWRIQHPDCTLDEVMNFVKGPDFPTGGIVMSSSGIRQAFERGRGKILIRGKAEIVEGRTINQIVITEIPYEVIKSNLVKKMDEIRLDQKVNGILDVRDESDRNGLRVVVDLKKEANAQATLNYFYKTTDLQVSYHYNVIAIVGKAPKQMGLLDMMDAFIDHRREVILHRSRYDLGIKQKRSHIVEGLIKAISILDEVIAIIRASSSKADSKKRLIEAFQFTEAQAEAIVTLQLYRLSNTDIQALEQEAQTLAEEIEQLKGVLESNTKLKNLMIRELKEMNAQFNTPRRSFIQHEVEDLVVDQRDMIADEQVMITISKQGYLKRVSMRSYGSSSKTPSGKKEGDVLLACGSASTLDTLMVFTDKGRYGSIPVYQIEEARWKDNGVHLSTYLKTEPQEKIVAAYLERQEVTGVDFVLLTGCGLIKRLRRENLTNMRGSRLQTVMGLADGDSLTAAVPVYHPDDQLFLISRHGYGLQYKASEAKRSSAKAKGVRAMNLAADDQTIQLLANVPSNLVLENTLGQFKRLDVNDIPELHRPAKGNRLFKPVKSRPTELMDVIDSSAAEELRVDDDQATSIESGKIPRMSAGATWSSVNELEKPAGFIRPLLHLENGTWPEDEKENEQLSLFGGTNA